RTSTVVVDRCRSFRGVVKIAQSPPGWHEELVGPPSRESEAPGAAHRQLHILFYFLSRK
ncbi:hypothetical protein BDFB_005118, partial [Asbolus verrucosus]